MLKSSDLEVLLRSSLFNSINHRFGYCISSLSLSIHNTYPFSEQDNEHVYEKYDVGLIGNVYVISFELV